MDIMIKSIGWNAAAELDNISRYGISFAEASHIFYCEEAAVCKPGNTADTDKIIIGTNDVSDELIVCRFEEEEGIIRIISARKANNKEKKGYEKYRLQKY